MAMPVRIGWAQEVSQPLVMVIDDSLEMPWARYARHEVVGGIEFDVAHVLASSLHRPLKLLQIPRRRLLKMLESGEADLLCGSDPKWLSGQVAWSVPFVSDDDVVITRKDAEQVKTIDDLSAQTLGTIAGFAYPELEQRLGAGFVRGDAPNMRSNLSKMSLGRVIHVVINDRSLMYLQRTGEFTLPIQVPLVVSHNQIACALSLRSSLSLDALNASIQALAKDGTWERISAQYR